MSTIEKSSRQEEMFALIEKWKQSSQTKKLFCEHQCIAPSSFYYWQKRYHQEQTGSAGFIPVLVKRSSSGLSQPLEVHYPSGVSVRVPSGSSITLLKALIDLL